MTTEPKKWGTDIMRFFTSDTHFGHARIIELSNRPFSSVSHMNAEIVRRWNELVMPDDLVFHLGDVALGRIDDSLPIVGQLNGYRVLVEGNHDRTFMTMGKTRYEEWLGRYGEFFDDIIGFEGCQLTLNDDTIVNLSHFPYDGDSHGDDRYSDHRPHDDGYTPLIHGHTHMVDRLTYSSQGTAQIHVGQDAWDFTPVSEDQVIDILQDI